MQFGIRLHDAVDVPIEERLKVVKEQGFTCAHVALSKVIKENSVANSALTPGYAMYLKRLFDKNEFACQYATGSMQLNDRIKISGFMKLSSKTHHKQAKYIL